MKTAIKKLWHSGDGVEKWLFENKLCGIPLYWIFFVAFAVSAACLAIEIFFERSPA